MANNNGLSQAEENNQKNIPEGKLDVERIRLLSQVFDMYDEMSFSNMLNIQNLNDLLEYEENLDENHKVYQFLKKLVDDYSSVIVPDSKSHLINEFEENRLRLAKSNKLKIFLNDESNISNDLKEKFLS